MMTSGPQRHGPKRMRNIAVPRLGDDCPFLELPPEVRNRIYEYALGGHNLHMFVWNQTKGENQVKYWHRTYNVAIGTRAVYDHYDGTVTQVMQHHRYRVQYVLCQCPGSDDEQYQTSCKIPAEQEKDTNNQVKPAQIKIKTYAKRHEKCFDVDVLKYPSIGMRKLLTTPRLALGLLRTCKQVYNEAALVPYYDNTFSFARGSDLDFFTRVLSEKQRSALQHVTYANVQPETHKSGGFALGTYLKTQFCDSEILKGLRPKAIDMLSGLAKLTITVDADDLFAWDAQRTLWRELPRFVRKGLKVEVLLRDSDIYTGRGLAIVRGFAEELEFGLARSTEDVSSYHVAREQLEYAQMQAAHLAHGRSAIAA